MYIFFEAWTGAGTRGGDVVHAHMMLVTTATPSTGLLLYYSVLNRLSR